jgi:hypothetical protein
MSDTKKKTLSYTSYGTYQTCPKKFDLYYNQKIRSETVQSHLVFGSATDKALNTLLDKGSKTEAIASAQLELVRLFTEKVQIEEKDFDHELITEETQQLLIEKLRDCGWQGTSPAVLASGLFGRITMGDELTADQNKMLLILVYFSFVEKIALIVQAFEDYVRPQIEEVVSVQKNVKRGILDFEARLKGVDGIVICDNKTASRDYEPDAVKMSVQLAGYGAEKGCYIVFNKTVKKNRVKTCSICGNDGTGKRHKSCDSVKDGIRCNGEWTETISPEIVPQIIIDEIPQSTREMVAEAYADTEKLIEAGVFPRNLNACGKQFGKPCEYFNLCWNGDMKGLKKDNNGPK